MDDDHAAAFNSAKTEYPLPPSIQITVHENRLGDLPASVTFDAIVSPANSYARLDGGFDDALSRAFSPKHDYLALTRHAQEALYKEWRGFAPPGTCTLIDLKTESLNDEPWGCRYLALCPTMKIPQKVTWDKEVVYECIWSLLTSVGKHNQSAAMSEPGICREIKSILMTPLATGYGGWSGAKWAAQLLLAIKHFVETTEKAEKWGVMDPIIIMKFAEEMRETHDL